MAGGRKVISRIVDWPNAPVRFANRPFYVIGQFQPPGVKDPENSVVYLGLNPGSTNAIVSARPSELRPFPAAELAKYKNPGWKEAAAQKYVLGSRINTHTGEIEPPSKWNPEALNPRAASARSARTAGS